MRRTALQTITEVLLVSGASVIAGFSIGTAAHFLGGSFAFGLSLGTLGLAGYVGGIPGAVAGLLVGLLVYFGILRKTVTWKDWAILTGVAFLTATITLLLWGRSRLIVAPLLTLLVALVLRLRPQFTGKLS